jgi:hypothetical protein
MLDAADELTDLQVPPAPGSSDPGVTEEVTTPLRQNSVVNA